MGMPGIRTGNDAYRIACCLRAAAPEELHEAVCYHTDRDAEQLVLRDIKTASCDIPEWMERREAPCHNDHISDVMEKMMYKDMVTYHPDDILVKVDRAGMAVSLENRVPMLDRDVVEFAYRIPHRYKYDAQGVSKKILKTILYRYVPKEMLDRPKKGFSVPLERWLTTGDTAEWAAESILTSRLAADGYFDRKALTRIWKNFQRNHKNAQILWEILMAEQWYRRVISNR